MHSPLNFPQFEKFDGAPDMGCRASQIVPLIQQGTKPQVKPAFCHQSPLSLSLLFRPSLGHLETLPQLSRLGAVIFPPVPGFYSKPTEVSDIVNQTCMRMLDQVGVEIDVAVRWGE